MNKISIIGLRDLATDEIINPQTDYRLSLIAQRISEEKEDQDSDDNPVIKFKLKTSYVESIEELGSSKKLKINPGKTKSQKQRFVIEQNLGKDEYGRFMDWLLKRLDNLCDEYRA